MRQNRRFTLTAIKDPIEIAIAWAEAIANNNKFQYSQPSRNSGRDLLLDKNLSYVKTYSGGTSYFDCSSFVSFVYHKATKGKNNQLPTGPDGNSGNSWWTGNQHSWTNYGFKQYSYNSVNDLRRGDVVVVHWTNTTDNGDGTVTTETLGHTFLYLGDGKTVEAISPGAGIGFGTASVYGTSRYFLRYNG